MNHTELGELKGLEKVDHDTQIIKSKQVRVPRVLGVSLHPFLGLGFKIPRLVSTILWAASETVVWSSEAKGKEINLRKKNKTSTI